MAGVKGKSGRRTNRANERIDVLAGLSIEWGIKNFSNFDDEQKMKILLSLGPKYVVEQHEHSGDLILQYGHRQ